MRKITVAIAAIAALAAFAPAASAKTVDCDDYVTSPFVRLKVENRVAGVRPTCGTAVVASYYAIRRSFPRFLSVYARGRSHFFVRAFIYRGGSTSGLFLVVYADRRLRITLTSLRGRIFDPCVMNVTDC
jgi:hypothetical protein